MQDERDQCLFINGVRETCTSVPVDEHAGCGSKRCDVATATGAREGHGDALAQSDRETTRVPRPTLEQDDGKVYLFGVADDHVEAAFGELKGETNLALEQTTGG